jgi:adenylate kinase
VALNVIMLGPPGAGKGTQAERLARTHGVPRISTGDILRDGIKQGLPLALHAKDKMDRGELVDDETMMGIVRERLFRSDTKKGFVLDGFPRTGFQGRALDEIMADRDDGQLVVVDIVVPEKELVRRLAARRICAACGTNADSGDWECRKCGGTLVPRSDDDERVVRERLKVYTQQSKPLVDFYRNRPTFRVVDGTQSPDRVFQQIEGAIQSALAGARALGKGAEVERR